MKNERKVSIERLRELFEYNSKTGIVVRISQPKYAPPCIGEAVGCPLPTGHLKVRVDGVCLAVHRIAWALHYGEWPVKSLDHIDGNPGNNKIRNLRLATKRQNGWNRGIAKNNKSGVTGVHWHQQRGHGHGAWIASIRINGKRKHLGCFDSLELAAEFRELAEVMVYGEYRRVR